MTLSSAPPVAASLIATTETVLHIAPVSKRWKTDAPSNVVFLPSNLTKQALLLQLALLRPSVIIIGDQIIDADVIGQWRMSHPFAELHLIRRGTSLDKVRVDLCQSSDIRVINTPGVNAPHVAAYIARWLTQADGSIPRDVCVLGYGNVGKELVKLLLDRDPGVRIKVLVRQGRAPGSDKRVQFVTGRREAMEGARAVAICLSLNDDTTHCIDPALIHCLHRQARLVCVAKPDVFSDDALQVLAASEGIQLVLDYGPATLDAFRMRAQLLGCCVSRWCKPATLTTQAATTEACQCDLDYAVAIELSLMALQGLVRRKLSQSLTIPSQPVDAGAQRVSIIGRGINGLLQAVMLRLATYQVTVYGNIQECDGANPLLLANQALTVECHRAGIELFEKFLADNPSLGPFHQEAGYEMERVPLVAQITMLLQCSGVEFPPEQLSQTNIAELSREQIVVTATGEQGGVSIVYCAASHQVAAGGTSEALVWASVVQEILEANRRPYVER